MGMVGAIGGALGGGLSAAGKDKISNQAYDTSRVIDNGTRSSAMAAGNHVLDKLPANFDTSQGYANDAASAFKSAASSPDIGIGQDYYRKVLNGGFLGGSPVMQNYWNSIRTATNAAAGNQDARARSQAALIGATPGGSTWNNMQAANRAAMNARANETILGSQAQNYQMERERQNSAPGALANYLSLPGQYLNNAASATMAPSLQAGQAMQANYLSPWTMGVENVLTKTPDALKKAGGIISGMFSGAAGGMTGGMGMGGMGGMGGGMGNSAGGGGGMGGGGGGMYMS